MRVVILFARLLETIGHALLLLLCQIAVLIVDHRVGSLVKLAALRLSLFIDRLIAGKRSQLQIILQLVPMLNRAHTQLNLVLTGLLFTRHEKVVERVPNVLCLSMIAGAVHGPVRGIRLRQTRVELGAKFTPTQPNICRYIAGWLLLDCAPTTHSIRLLQDQRLQGGLD